MRPRWLPRLAWNGSVVMSQAAAADLLDAEVRERARAELWRYRWEEAAIELELVKKSEREAAVLRREYES